MSPPEDSDTKHDNSKPTPSNESCYLNNPDKRAAISIDYHAPPSTRDKQITHAVSLICPQMFSPHRSQKLSVSQLGGGLSNHLFIVSSSPANDDDDDDSSSSKVLIRIHVSDDCHFVNRKKETSILAHLAREGKAPLLYGCFCNGRIEEFYSGAVTLTHSDIMTERYIEPVARAMAGLHGMAGMNLGAEEESSAVLEGGEVWERVGRWLELARVSVMPEGCRRDDNDVTSALDLISSIEKEWKCVRNELMNSEEAARVANERYGSVGARAVHFSREVVFTHMDCQSLNILTSEKWSSKDNEAIIRLIDFEYAGMNPRSMDIANTFCECCDMNNMAADYEKEYPTSSRQDLYLTIYMKEVRPSLAEWLDECGGWETFLEVWREDVMRYALVSHLAWAVWAVAQSYISTIEFDYLGYASHRMEGYWIFKRILSEYNTE